MRIEYHLLEDRSLVLFIFTTQHSSQGINWMGTINWCLRKRFCKAGVWLVGGQKTEALLLSLGTANKPKFPHMWHDLMMPANFSPGFILKQRRVMFVLKIYVLNCYKGLNYCTSGQEYKFVHIERKWVRRNILILIIALSL